jgi:DNA-binding winged helix-turn-helix (wHTH) protein
MKGRSEESPRESVRVLQNQTMRVRFGPFVFDSETRQLLDDGRALHLSPKSFDLLQLLIEHRPAVVSKNTLQDHVWPDTFVDEANVGNAVAEIRKVLGDDPKSPTYVATVARRGYRFCADAGDIAVRGGAERRPLQWWLTWNETTLPLSEGENIVGRHPSSSVWINGKSVSREHARITINGGRATIEDRGSTNGTFVDGKQISSSHPLVDGAAITFGSEKATFRQWSDEAAAPTEPVRARS